MINQAKSILSFLLLLTILVACSKQTDPLNNQANSGDIDHKFSAHLIPSDEGTVVELRRENVEINRHRSENVDLIKSLESEVIVFGESVLVVGDVNPSLSIGIIFDMSNGSITEYDGVLFTVNAKTGDVAYVRNPPHFNSADVDGLVTSLYINNQLIQDFDARSIKHVSWDVKGGKVMATLKNGKVIAVESRLPVN